MNTVGLILVWAGGLILGGLLIGILCAFIRELIQEKAWGFLAVIVGFALIALGVSLLTA